MGSNASLEASLVNEPNEPGDAILVLTVRKGDVSPRNNCCSCSVSSSGLRDMFSASSEHVPPFLRMLTSNEEFLERYEQHDEASFGMSVRVVVDRSVALSAFIHADTTTTEHWMFPTTHTNGTGHHHTASSRRSCISSFITTLASALVLNGQVYAQELLRKKPIHFRVDSIDVSYNDIGDSDGLWISQELVDRCERSIDATPNIARYAERLRQQLKQAATPSHGGNHTSGSPRPEFPTMDTLSERIVHTFANATCGPQVRSLRLQGARFTTQGMSRVLRTLFQRHEVVPRAALEERPGLVCGLLEVVDLRGPWTDVSGTSMRIVEDLCSRIESDGWDPPEILLQRTTLPEVANPFTVAPVLPMVSVDSLHATVAPSKVSQPPLPSTVRPESPRRETVTHVDETVKQFTSVTPSSVAAEEHIVEVRQAPPAKQHHVSVLSLHCQSSLVSSRSNSPQAQCLVHSPRVARSPIPVPVLFSSTPRHNGNNPITLLSEVALRVGASSTQQQERFVHSESDVDAASDASTCSELPEADEAYPAAPVVYAPVNTSTKFRQPEAPITSTPPLAAPPAVPQPPPMLNHSHVAPIFDAAEFALLELEQLSSRAAVAADVWKAKFLGDVDKLTKLVSSSSHAQLLKSDNLVAEFRQSTHSSVVFLHNVTCCLHQWLLTTVTTLGASFDSDDGREEGARMVDPNNAEERIGLALAECCDMNTCMLQAEAFLQEADMSSASSYQRTAAAEALCVLTAVLKAHKGYPPSVKQHHGAPSLHLQWTTFWKALTAFWLTSEDDTLLSNISVEELIKKIYRTMSVVRDCGARIEADLVRATVVLVDRWTALLRRWLVEGEIARRQAVRALNRRRHNDIETPSIKVQAAPTAAPHGGLHGKTKVDTFADPASDVVPTQRRATPTKTGRHTSPTSAATSPSYAHIKARVSTRRPYEGPPARPVSPTTRPLPGIPVAQPHAQQENGASSRHTDSTECQQAATVCSPDRFATSSAAPPSDLIMISPPRTSPQHNALLPRGTNATALRRIMTLESKIAELEQQRPTTPQRRDRRRNRTGEDHASLLPLNATSLEPLPRVAAAPVPAMPVHWSMPEVVCPPATPAASTIHAPACNSAPSSKGTNDIRAPPATIAFVKHQEPQTKPLAIQPAQQHHSDHAVCLVSYITPSTNSSATSATAAAPLCNKERSSSTNASVAVAHAILFQPISQPQTKSQHVPLNHAHRDPPQPWSFPTAKQVPASSTFVSQDVLSYIISSAQRTSSTSSSTTNGGSAEHLSSRSSSIQYFARSTSRATEEEIYHV